ncbi:hypothetical protein GJ744_009732 [Endocarpon pusillum]|uniref:Peroxin 20 n=1 Tax=Endocarpon pusillum TaxID=364733 RepID=A0A8H7EB08_9EURO|nr:hypothetical protein GJ744_009732 [Endocarpon pusillum]
MADALCGPANPLQSFKNHSQVDRSLQQDRTVGARHPPAQGFRTPDPRAGSLDAELAAFEAGSQQALYHQQPLFASHLSSEASQSLPQPYQQKGHSAPRWAADFQNLYLGSAHGQPISQNQFRPEAPLMRPNVESAAGGWRDDFMRRQQQYSFSSLNGAQPMRSQMVGLGYMQGQPMSQYYFAQQQPGIYQELPPHSVEEMRQGAYPDTAHSAAFEAAFAQAEGAYVSKEKETQSDLSDTEVVAGVRLDPIFNNQSSDLNRSQPATLEPPEQTPMPNFLEQEDLLMRIGSDSISYNDHKTTRSAEQNSRNADELARTAGRLLNSMAGETSPKFEQSQFLSLMRKIRDGQVVVRGDEFHEIDKSAETTRNEVWENATRPSASSMNPPGEVQAGRQNDASADYQNQLLALQERKARRDFKARGEDDEARREETRSGEVWGSTSEEEMARAQEDVQALHPGGRGYPVPARGPQSPEMEDKHRYDHWASGGIGIEDDETDEENHGLADRFSKVNVQG